MQQMVYIRGVLRRGSDYFGPGFVVLWRSSRRLLRSAGDGRLQRCGEEPALAERLSAAHALGLRQRAIGIYLVEVLLPGRRSGLDGQLTRVALGVERVGGHTRSHRAFGGGEHKTALRRPLGPPRAPVKCRLAAIVGNLPSE